MVTCTLSMEKQPLMGLVTRRVYMPMESTPGRRVFALEAICHEESVVHSIW